jgi:hypothetical protein
MRDVMLLACFVVFGLSACAKPIASSADPSELEQNDSIYGFGEKCIDAK